MAALYKFSQVSLSPQAEVFHLQVSFYPSLLSPLFSPLYSFSFSFCSSSSLFSLSFIQAGLSPQAEVHFIEKYRSILFYLPILSVSHPSFLCYFLFLLRSLPTLNLHPFWFLNHQAKVPDLPLLLIVSLPFSSLLSYLCYF